MRTKVPLALDYGQARSAVGSGGSLVNFFAQATPVGAKDEMVLVGAPGTKARTQLRSPNDEDVLTDETLVHAAIVAWGKLLVVGVAGTYLVDDDWTWDRIGDGMAGPVSLAFNGIDVAAVNGVTGRWITQTTVEPIVDVDFYPADSVAFLDGYFVFNRKGTGQVFSSEPYSRALLGLSFATAEDDPDHTVGVLATSDNLLVFGERTTEPYYNAGAGQFPFAPVPGGSMAFGCAAAATAARYGATVFWLSDKGLVIAAEGLRPTRISDHEVEAAIKERQDDWPAARGFVTEDEGHTFYHLTVGDLTMVYDLSTGRWHLRSNYSRGHELARCHAFAWKKHVVGDDKGRLLELSSAFLDDAGEPLFGEIVSMPYHADREVMSLDAVELQTDPGVSPIGENYRVLMSVSRDQGRTWSSERPAAIGRTGDYRGRLVWRRCGAGTDIRLRFRMSEPFRRAFLSSAFLEV